MKDEKYPYVSECCGASPRSNGDSDTSDYGLCSECNDHCTYGYFDSDGNFFETEEEAIEKDLINENEKLKL